MRVFTLVGPPGSGCYTLACGLLFAGKRQNLRVELLGCFDHTAGSASFEKDWGSIEHCRKAGVDVIVLPEPLLNAFWKVAVPPSDLLVQDALRRMRASERGPNPIEWTYHGLPPPGGWHKRRPPSCPPLVGQSDRVHPLLVPTDNANAVAHHLFSGAWRVDPEREALYQTLNEARMDVPAASPPRPRL